MYRVRGDHLRGIEIVAPATQKPFDTSQQACIGSGEIISEASKLLHLRGDHLRGIKIAAPATQKPFDTSQPACIGSGENISEASKLLHLPRPFPTSMYRVRGDHLRGITIVAPATQKPFDPSQQACIGSGEIISEASKIVAPATQKPFDPSQQACIGSGEIISEASKLLHLPHKSHLTLPNQHV